MIDLQELQKKVWDNKVKKGFNTTDVCREFCLLHEEVSEAFHAYNKKLPDLDEELADVAIYLLGLFQMLGIDLEDAILKKIGKNALREYQKIDGVMTRTKEASTE